MNGYIITMIVNKKVEVELLVIIKIFLICYLFDITVLYFAQAFLMRTFYWEISFANFRTEEFVQAFKVVIVIALKWPDRRICHILQTYITLPLYFFLLFFK